MKFLVMSDNHGRWPLVWDLVSNLRPQVDYIFHTGDSEFASDDPIWELVDGSVTGNMDFDPGYPATQVIETPVGKVFLAHGHRHGVNSGHDEILRAAKEADCCFAFHGHSHVLKAEYVDGVYIVNPGSLNHSRGPVPYTTYAIVSVDDQEVSVDFYNEAGELLKDLNRHFPVND
ncbi:YfcE family phosphodiesterase [Hutsoniella sourekii]|uniref:YfcE family phosphodiesterase n=1 Tax=Hutsoniella sourekii TaxID=87650 RepID=UPI0004863C47|nr:YfcE family phosphodiesterase [Hutsoniella sourekii]